MFGMKATFTKDSVSTARMVFVGVWLFQIVGGMCAQFFFSVVIAGAAASALAAENRTTGITSSKVGSRFGVDRWMLTKLFEQADTDQSGFLESKEMIDLLSVKM